MADIALVKALAQSLRYRELPDLMGKTVHIQHIGTIEANVRSSLGSALPSDCRLIAPEPRIAWVTVRSHLILDLTFQAPKYLLDTQYESGRSLLKKLNFLPDTDEDTLNQWIPEALDLERLLTLKKELENGETVIRLFLQAQLPSIFTSGVCVDPLPSYPLPCDFIIHDACATNSAFVWFHKHFYVVDQVYLRGL